MEGDQEQDEEDDLYRDVSINLERSDAEMTNAQVNQDTNDTHVTLTTVPLVFDQRVFALEIEMSEFKQTNQFAEAVSSILGIVDNYLASKIKETIDVKAQVSKIMPKVEKYITEYIGAEVLVRSTNQPQTSYAINIHTNFYNALVKSYNSDKDIISSYGDVVTLKRGQDDQDKDEDPSAGSNRGSMRRRSCKEAESLKEPTHKESKSTSSSKVDDLEDQPHQEFNIGNDDVTPERKGRDDVVCQWNPSSSPTLDHKWHKTKTIDNKPPQPWITQLAQAAGTQSSFNEFLATPIDFSAFIMNQLKIDNLTQEVLTGPNYDLIKGTCKNVVELEYHLEEVFKATNDQLDWHNPEGKLYPHDLSKPLLLILNERGCQVIPLDHFINNDLEYLKGGSSSKKYTTSITKTKAADYGQVKWIEVKDDQIYKFREGDFKRLRRQDIKDMLLLFVQDKLTNLNLDECQNWRDLPKDIPLDSVVVLRYEKRSKSENKGKVPAEMELVLEQTQQGTSYEVSVSAERVEELKRKVKIKGEKKKPSSHLGRNRVNTSAVKNHKDDC
ncbi:hypothetical protein Tco_0215221 [Tanacetum coccineum]